MKPITVLLAEDHAILREGIRSLLETNGDFKVVGEASNGRQAVDLAQKLHPAVAVMDISMPVLNGFEATRQIRVAAPDTKVLALSAHGDDEHVAHMTAVGATGYVVKQSAGQVLFHAIKEVANGHPFFSPSIAKRLEKVMQKARAIGVTCAQLNRSLTTRESEVLQRVAEGAANKQVAAELGISIKTVEKHRQNLMDKLDIHDTAGLTRHAMATGVIAPGAQLMW